MTDYRTEIKRIQKKLESIAQQGEVAILEYYTYIDELINDGKYSILLNVLITSYNLDLRIFKTIDEFKRNSFQHIRNKTISKEQKKLNDIFSQKGVYVVGTHFYSSANNKYIGDIFEVEPEYSNNLHILKSRPWSNPVVNLNVVRGLSSAIFQSIPIFGSITYDSFFYVTQSQVSYDGKIYECTKSFTYSKGGTPTPTFSEFFTQSIFPKYTLINISDKSMSLLDKYSLGIDILKL